MVKDANNHIFIFIKMNENITDKWKIAEKTRDCVLTKLLMSQKRLSMLIALEYLILYESKAKA